MTNDIILEALNALLIAGIILYQLKCLRKSGLKGTPGTRLILAGFGLMLLGACLDITDEFPQLNHFVVIGDTPVEAFFEKFFGYMLGSLLLLVGFSRMLPVFEQLGEKQRLIETIIETIPAPTFCKDEKGRYLHCNNAFEEFIGVSRERIIGQTVYAVAAPDLAEIYHQADQGLIAELGKQTYETQVESSDGGRREVLFHKAVFHKEDGSAGGLVGVMLDISDRKKVEEGLRHIDQMKSEFISTAAHELRTPLTSIRGYTELLLSADGTRQFSLAQKTDFLQEIFQASELLGKLVDELLDVGRIERGLPLPLEIKPQRPEALFQKIVDGFRLKHEQQHPLLLVSQLPADCEVAFDQYRMRQLVDNLLSNAVKYSPEGGTIKLVISLVDHCFQLEIIDQGIGMKPDQLAQIFDKFYRAGEERSRISGMGIGMSIVKNIVESHRGTIEVESRLGEGTCIRVKIPLQIAREKNASGLSSEQAVLTATPPIGAD
ncbi:sensor histidine kinase [Geopsychrobacter electrodiphilus]|uniref:sensor histidine kinase n=1 Tax=Geopsychrobacter electrodiphilus TaxID=225196 RepID=UPI00035F8F56|nr:HAMP domain-containing sensor histidine kinase [Geopsychrobacter electrodiphilus]